MRLFAVLALGFAAFACAAATKPNILVILTNCSSLPAVTPFSSASETAL